VLTADAMAVDNDVGKQVLHGRLLFSGLDEAKYTTYQASKQASKMDTAGMFLAPFFGFFPLPR
jgi:hypothetical protein